MLRIVSWSLRFRRWQWGYMVALGRTRFTLIFAPVFAISGLAGSFAGWALSGGSVTALGLVVPAAVFGGACLIGVVVAQVEWLRCIRDFGTGLAKRPLRADGRLRVDSSLVSEALQLEIEREDDGRWIAEVPSLPGVLVYGSTREEAVHRAEALALRVLADRIEHGEEVPAIAHLFAKA